MRKALPACMFFRRRNAFYDRILRIGSPHSLRKRGTRGLKIGPSALLPSPCMLSCGGDASPACVYELVPLRTGATPMNPKSPEAMPYAAALCYSLLLGAPCLYARLHGNACCVMLPCFWLPRFC
jgi:hypothetical protein